MTLTDRAISRAAAQYIEQVEHLIGDIGIEERFTDDRGAAYLRGLRYARREDLSIFREVFADYLGECEG
jgi:hypothetical protein